MGVWPWWQDVVAILVDRVEGIQAIVLYGSQTKPHTVDFWSDADLLVVLAPDRALAPGRIAAILTRLGTLVVGCERHEEPGRRMLLRLAIMRAGHVRMLDLTVATYADWANGDRPHSQQNGQVIYGILEIAPSASSERAPDPDPYVAYAAGVDAVWFKYVMAIKKFYRGDDWIGLHLLLDLVREYLVLEMIERDVRLGTTIHRFGGQERLPEGLALSALTSGADLPTVLGYLARLAAAYDEKLASHLPDYRRRYPAISAYLAASAAQSGDR